jgi:pimeloyl-ACP methyl ester carboxylesterase
MKNVILAVGVALGLAICPSAFAATPAKPTPAKPTPAKPTVVLVHGAWADGSSWNKVIPLLQAKGITVMTVQNPLTSLADDVAATQRVLADVQGPVVLVGHSWAGTVITQAGTDPKVRGLVYVAAFANKDGQSGGDLVGAYPKPPAFQTLADDGHGFLRQTEEGMLTNFAPDIAPEEARTLAVTQGPLAAVTFGDKVTDAAWKTRPSWYIVSANDRVINPQMERDLAKEIGAKTTVLASSHVSLLSHPREVAAVIEDAVAAVAAGATK